MSKKGKLRVLEGGRLAFWCPGCKEYHVLPIDRQERPVWSFNGNYDQPTFSPSVLYQSGHFISGKKVDCWCDYHRNHPDEPQAPKCIRCHSFVRNGKIQYLTDSSHELSGQTIEMADPDKEL